MCNEDSLISIIVPVYNVSKYLEKCIESLVNQTYKNLEIILVDDGSTDNSLAICHKYSGIDSRIKVLHKENGGLSSARNAALDILEGEYLMFVDSDDWIDVEMIHKLYSELKNRNADIAICNFERTSNENNKIDNRSNEAILEMTSIEALRNLYSDNIEVQMITSWCKLYKSNLFKQIRFPEGKIHEDEFTTYRLYSKSEKIIYLDEKLYYYRITPGSIMNSKFNLKRLDILEAFNERMHFANDLGDREFYLGTLKRYYLESFNMYFQVRCTLNDEKEVINDLEIQTKNIGRQLLETKNYSFYQYIKIKLFLFNSSFYYIVKKYLAKISNY